MKKLCYTFATLLLTSATLSAQEDINTTGSSIDTRKLRFGAYVAPNISWMKPTASKSDDGAYNVENNGNKTGFTFGLMADYQFAENYAIVTGLQLNNTGGKILATTTNGTPAGVADLVRTADFSYKLSYIEIPLALKLRTDDISGFRFFGQLGLTAAFNIGKKATYTVDYNDANGNAQSVTDENVKLPGALGITPIQLQMNIGAGAEYPINNKLKAYAGIFFNNGFLETTNPHKFNEEKLGYRGEFRDGNTRLNNFALRVGLFF